MPGCINPYKANHKLFSLPAQQQPVSHSRIPPLACPHGPTTVKRQSSVLGNGRGWFRERVSVTHSTGRIPPAPLCERSFIAARLSAAAFVQFWQGKAAPSTLWREKRPSADAVGEIGRRIEPDIWLLIRKWPWVMFRAVLLQKFYSEICLKFYS